MASSVTSATDSASVSVGAGNTKSAPAKQENPKQWFNWTVNETVGNPEYIQAILVPKCTDFCFQLEVGEETGYRHYQGVMRTKARTRWSEVRQWMPEGTHLEITRSWSAQWEYCQKLETREGGPWMLERPVKKGGRPKKQVVEEVPEWPVARRPRPEVWYPWQQELLEYAGSLPDERTVVWVYDQEGKKGKTTVGHELCKKYDGIVIDGSKRDILSMASQKWHRLWIVELERDTTSDKAPYRAIEKLKGGMYMNSKFECVSIEDDRLVHVIVLANCAPILTKLTVDRWKLITI